MMKYSIKEIIEQMPENLSDIEKVRYIYLKCGELFAYDRDYIYSGLGETSTEIYERRFIWPNNYSRNQQGRIKVTCNQISDALNSAINTMTSMIKTDENISARKIGYVEGEQYHVATLVDIGDNTYFLDLNSDLYKIQRGMKTKYFAPSNEVLEIEKRETESIKNHLKGINCTSLTEEELVAMDKKCGYNKNGIYMDDAIKYLREEMQDEENLKQYIDEDDPNREYATLKWKLDFICKYLINNERENKLDMKELDKYFVKLYHGILTEEEKRTNMLVPIDVHLDGEQSILFNIYTQYGQLFYLYKGEDIGIERVSQEEVEELKKGRMKYDANMER